MKNFIIGTLLISLNTNTYIPINTPLKGEIHRKEVKIKTWEDEIKERHKIQLDKDIKKQLFELDKGLKKIKEEELRKQKLKKKKDMPYKNIINVETTGYCNCSICSEGWGGITAMGTRTRDGVVAMPKSIPLGTKVEINGKIYTVEDRGGAVIQKGDTYIVDIWYPSHEQALKHGRQKTKAYIIK